MPRDMKNPPKFAPNAVATERGWVDPKTGELLVAIKGLEVKPAKKAKAAPKKKEPVVEAEPVEAEEPVVEKKPTAKKKGWGRK